MFGKKKRIYIDAAAATPLTPLARTWLVKLLDVYGNPGALHHEGVEAAKELLIGRKEIAKAIEAHADEIVFTASGTEANNLALFGVSVVGGLAGKHVITSMIEHPSVLEPLREMERGGLSVTYLKVDAQGLIDLQALADAITEKTTLVSISIINSEIGVIQDVRAIAKVIRAVRKKRGDRGNLLYFHVDASQAPLWVRLRVEALGCDMMTLDAQKIGGPKGVGLLYVKRGTKLSARILGGGQEGGLRSGTENVPLVGSFAAALMDAQAQCEEHTKYIAPVRDYLYEAIHKRLPGTVVNGSMEHRVANNLNVSIPGLIGERAVIALSAYGISASTRSACAAKDEDLSHVLLALGVGPTRAREAVRFTLLPTATKKEMDRVAEGLAKAYSLYANVDHQVK